jgi:nitrate/nitrite transporter NarK
VLIESITESSEADKEEIKLADLKKLNSTFWLLVTLCMFAVGLYVPFMDGANKLFIVRFCFSPVGAGKALMVTYIVAAVFSAPLGLLIDKIGFKRYFIMICMVVFTVAQLIILVYPQCGDG